MCGICGFFSEDFSGFDIEKMLEPIKHRGPDGRGVFIGKNCTLGHQRLSIIDLEGGKQPLANENETVFLVCNGEIYNYVELRKKLEKKGHKFKTKTDSEVILHLYEDSPNNFVHLLDGMFAFAIWDENKKKLLLARDPVGIKPLYYYYNRKEKYLIFSSEVKSILNSLNTQLTIDIPAFHMILKWRIPLYGLTLFKGLKKVIPGTVIEFTTRNPKRYYFHHWEFYSGSNISVKTIIESTWKILNESVHKRLMSDVPIGVFLSGGLDSSIITYLMDKHSDQSVNTFTVKSNGLDVIDESPYAKLIVEQTNSNHKVLEASLAEFERSIPKVIWLSDEPILDPAILPTYIMSELARKEVKVVLTGEGADELFLGYPRYKLLLKPLSYLPRKIKNNFYDFFPPGSTFTSTERNKMCNTSINNVFKMNSKPISFKKWILYRDLSHWLPNYLLAKVDRMSMAVGLEARVPYLDKKLINYLISIPPSFKTSLFSEKFLLRRIFQGKLPQTIVNRKKYPFSVPYTDWFRELDLEKIVNRFNTNFKPIGVKFHNNKTPDTFYKGLKSKNPFKRLRITNKIWLILGLIIWHDQLVQNHNYVQIPNKPFDQYL